ncbi:hypothetical protein [Ruminococcus sp. 5_1_39BFAA]|uniref:hypothetical protein n=1 Tax=Ruminococcus sp. 5_1_39BFAA TaxID=457412 RepID=UPI003564382C
MLTKDNKNLDRAAEALLHSFSSCYDIYRIEPQEAGGQGKLPVTARCEFYERSEKFVISRKAELWSANGEEFLYIIKVPQLTLELFERYRDQILEDGRSRIHIGPGHMYSYITPVFLCNSCDEDARKALMKCRVYQSFKFSFHGWMDFHTAVIELSTGRIDANRSGREIKKNLKQIHKSWVKNT